MPAVDDMLRMARATWSEQTLQGLVTGRVRIPDDLINEQLSRQRIQGVDEVALASLGHDRLEAKITTRDIGLIRIKARLLEIRHDDQQSFLRLRLLEREAVDLPHLSWLLSGLSLAVLSRLFGKFATADGVRVTLAGPEVLVDCRDLLTGSPAGSLGFFGIKLLEMIEIKSAAILPGALELHTALNFPYPVRSTLTATLSALGERLRQEV